MKRGIRYFPFLVIVILFMSVGAVSGDYIGPQRTVTKTTHVTIVKEIATDWWMCTVFSWPPEFSADGCSESEFNYYRADPDEYSLHVSEVTHTTTYPPATVSGAFVCSDPGDNGWCRGGAGIALSGSEPLSGYEITSIEGSPGELCSGSSCTWSLSEGEGNIDFWAHSSFGDTSEESSLGYKVDTQAPLIDGLPLPDGENGWYVTPMDLAPVASEATSGIASQSICLDGSCGGSISLGEGVHSIQVNATDGAGNTASTGPFQVKVDLTAPTFSELPSPDGSDGWFISPVTIPLGADDSTSGIDSESICLDGTCGETISMAEGNHTITRSAKDVAGNISSTDAVSIKCDWTPPSSRFTDPPEGASVVSPGNINLSGMSTDNLSSVSQVQISLDGGTTWNDLSLNGDAWTFTWDTTGLPDGTYPVYARAKDVAGNQESTAKVEVIVSNAPPRVRLQKWFVVGRPGSLEISPNPLIPLAHVSMVVSGEGKHPDRVVKYGSRVHDSVSWDGQWGDGSDASWGSYIVTVSACDVNGKCGSDSGTIFVPRILPVIPTPTPTQTPTPTAIPTIQKAVVVTEAPVTPTPVPTTVLVSEVPEKPKPVVIPWPFLTVLGLLAGFGILAISDPRPAALKSFSKTLEKIILKKLNSTKSRRKHDR